MMNWQTIPALWLNFGTYYPWLFLVGGLLLKSAVIFFIARLAAKCLMRRSARARNWLWRVTLAVMLAWPCWEVTALCIRDFFHVMWAIPVVVGEQTYEHQIFEDLRVINNSAEREEFVRENTQDNPPWKLFASNADHPVEFQKMPWRWLEKWGMPLWLTVSAALLLEQILRARAARRWLNRHARAADAQLAAGLPLTVSVFLHERLKSPLIVSGKIPRVYLPADAQRWSRAELRAVLLHELAHWQRHDLFWQKIGNLARAVWWWNPFARRAAAHMAREAELAADDAVLIAQVPAPDYAQTLVSVAARASSLNPLTVGIPFIGKQPLQRRIQTLLSPNHWRGKIGRLALTLIMLSGVLALLTVSVKVMWQRQILTPEKFQQWQRELEERWIRSPAALSPEQQRLASDTLAALKSRLTSQRYLHFKQETLTRKQDNVSGNILFAGAVPGRLELWIDGWRQKYRADVQPERDARGNTISLTVDTIVINDDQKTYYQWGNAGFHVVPRSESSFGFDRMPMLRLTAEAAQQLQTFLGSIGKNHYSTTAYEIGMTEWQRRPAVFFRIVHHSYVEPQQETFLFDPQQNYALVCHQNFDRADWELLASGTDADGQPYPQKYRITDVRKFSDDYNTTPPPSASAK